MDSRDPVFIIAAIIIFIGAAYLIYEYGNSISDHNGHEGEFNEAEEIYFKFLNYDPGESYTKVYSLDIDGLEKTLKLVKNGDEKYYELSTIFDTIKLYYTGEETIMCIEYGKKNVCSVVKDSELNDYVLNAERDFPSTELYEGEKELSEMLIEKGAMEFSNKTEEKEVGEFSCTEIEYTVDYKELTVDELQELGMNPNSMQVAYNYLITMCIDENGELIDRNLVYTVQELESYSTRTLLEKGDAEEIMVPETLANESELISLYSSVTEAELNIYECLYDADPDGCFKEEGAYSGQSFYCEMAGEEKDSCTTIVAVEKLDVTLCEKIESSSLKDDCYFEIAYRLADMSLCDYVQDETAQFDCYNKVSELFE